MSTSSVRRRRLDYEEHGSKRQLKGNGTDSDEYQDLCDDDTPTNVFPKGTIKRIRLKHFMTFDNFSEEFEPKLNVILAPNGTGKSSLVCGICLGLGGRPTLLGRQKKLSDFVKRGEEEGFIEIYISDGQDQSETKIRRELRADSDTTKWSINGCATAARDVEEIVTEMNIQLNNLLQFMPQDRVSEFAALTPVLLLQETQRAINTNLSKKHQRLIEMGNNSSTAQKNLQKLQNDLETAMNRKNSLQGDVDRLREVECLKKQISYLEAKLQIGLIQKAASALNESKEKLNSGREALKSKEEVSINLNKEFMTIARKKEKVSRSIQTFKAEVEKRHEAIDKSVSQTDKYEQQTDEKSLKLQNLKRESRKQQDCKKVLEDKIDEVQGKIHEAQKECEEVEEQCSVEEKIVRDLVNKLRPMNFALKETEEQYENLKSQKPQIEESLRQLDQINVQRMLELEKRRPLFRGLLQAHNRLKELASEFIKPVIGPLITEVNINDPTIAAYLEQQVPLASWTLFIVQCREDLAKIKSLNLLPGINAINFTGDPDAKIGSSPCMQELTQHGVMGRLIDLFEAKNIVKIVLDDECNLERTIVGTSATENHIERLFEIDKRIQKLYTPEKSFTIRRSQYSDATSVATNSVRSSTLLGHISRSTDEKKELEQKLDNINKKLSSTIQEMCLQKRNFSKIKIEHESAEAKRKQVRMLKRELESKVISLNRSLLNTQKELHDIRNLPDPTSLESEIKKEIGSLQQSLFHLASKMRLEQKEQWKIMESLSHTMLSHKCLSIKYFRVQNQLHDSRQQVNEVQALVEHLDQIVEQDSDELNTLKEELQRKFPAVDTWKDELDTLPDDSEELEEMLSETTHKINMMTVNNPSALTLYEELTARIEKLTTEIQERQIHVQETSGRIEEAKRVWLSELSISLAEISNAFANNIESIGCIGQVSLAGEETHGHDFYNYGLEIKVKFRSDEPLQVLDCIRQSGGERVVATTLYLISLQNVAGFPFRIMDEINHGMDEENERKVMDILASNVDDERMPQTFLFTPKMFTHFSFLEKATTFVLMNGPQVHI